ncbi:MAG: hypothetical protein AAGG68_27940 [Bacteroidota bacterium]
MFIFFAKIANLLLLDFWVNYGIAPLKSKKVAPINNQDFEVAIAAGTLQSILKNGILDKLEEFPVEPVSLATTNFDFIENQPKRFVFLGIVNQAGRNGDELPAIVLVDSQMCTYTNMATILVDTFINRALPVGTPVEITWVGTKKTGRNNNVRLWKVCLVRPQAKA